MRYIIAIFCPPLALLLCGRLLSALLNVLLCLIPLVAVFFSIGMLALDAGGAGILGLIGSIPLAGLCVLLAVIHSLAGCELYYRAERRHEMNLMLAAQGHNPLPEVSTGWPLWLQLPFAFSALALGVLLWQQLAPMRARVAALQVEARALKKARPALEVAQANPAQPPPAPENSAQEETFTLRLLKARAALEGKTLVEVEGTHGPALSKDKDTGWATWPKFKAQFQAGKVVDVEIP